MDLRPKVDLGPKGWADLSNSMTDPIAETTYRRSVRPETREVRLLKSPVSFRFVGVLSEVLVITHRRTANIHLTFDFTSDATYPQLHTYLATFPVIDRRGLGNRRRRSSLTYKSIRFNLKNRDCQVSPLRSPVYAGIGEPPTFETSPYFTTHAGPRLEVGTQVEVEFLIRGVNPSGLETTLLGVRGGEGQVYLLGGRR